MAITSKVKKAINGLARRRNWPLPFALRPIHPYIPQIKNPVTPYAHIAFVGTEDLGFDKAGKMRPQHYLPAFHRQMALKHNISCYYYQSNRHLIRDIETHKKYDLLVIYVYGEDKEADSIPRAEVIEEAKAHHSKLFVANHPRIGLLLRDKLATNLLLNSNHIPVPSIIDEGSPGQLVFSNLRFGSNTQSSVISDGKLRGDRYNAEYVDTTIHVDGVPYYCSLRALTAAGQLLDLWPRFRPASDGDASVHTYDVPRDPYLLNHFYDKVAMPLRERVQRLCVEIEKVIGVGFYAHDILYDPINDKLFVCEIGHKFHDYDVPEHFGDLAIFVPWLKPHAGADLPEKAADALSRHIRQLAGSNWHVATESRQDQIRHEITVDN